MTLPKISQNGPILMVIASFIFSLMSVLIKYLGKDIPCMEIIFFRSISSLTILMVLVLIFQTHLLSGQYKFLILRGVSSFCAFTIFYYAITQMHLARVSVIMQTRPFIVLVLAYFFLKEKLSGKEFWVLMVSFPGVLFMLKSEHSQLGIDFVSLICLLGVIFAALSAVIVKYVTATIPTICILFYFMLVSSVCSLPLTMNDFVLPDLNQTFVLVLIGVLSTFAQLLMTEAIRFSKTTIVALVGYIGVVFSSIWELLFWNALPDLDTIIGGIIIGIAVVFLAIQKKRSQSP